MKRLPYPTAKVLLTSAAILTVGVFSSQRAVATDYVFTGTGQWYGSPTNPNWTPTPSPGLTNTTLTVAGNTATINGTVDYNAGAAGGDFMMGNGDTMTVDNGSWTQAVGTNNWVKIGTTGATATINVINNGTFNVLSTGQQFYVGNGGSANVTVGSTGGGITITPTTVTTISAGSTLTLNGGTNSFGQIAVTGTMQVGGGTNSLSNFTGVNILSVSGGSTSFSGAFSTSSTSVISISGGSVTGTGNGNVSLNSAARFTLSGTGSFSASGTGEFQPGYTFSGGTSMQSISDKASLTIAGIVAFQGGSTMKFDVNGGTINIKGTSNNGIFSNGAYFNFTPGSSGTIDLTNISVANAIADINANKIRYNDTAYTTSNYSSAFTVISDGGNGSLIYLLGGGGTAVPEPSTWIGGALLFGLAGWAQRGPVRGFLRALRGALG